MFDNQKIILYANKKNTPSRDGYMITQIKRSILFAGICNKNNRQMTIDHGELPEASLP